MMDTASLICALAAPLWLVCGVLSYGWSLAYFQREYLLIADENRSTDRLFCAAMSLLGPFALVAFVLAIGPPRHGFQWW